jgi:thiamine biosynthesis protein ThiI
MMLRYADLISEKESADALIMGDSLGQVASQTLQNIRVVDQAVGVPVLRPLIGLDKEEIITVAKKIETFDLSISPSEACKAVPNKPATQAKLEKIEEIENELSFESLIKKFVSEARVLSVKDFDSFSDL